MRWCLVFLLIAGCAPHIEAPSIVWENEKAVGVLLDVPDTTCIYVEGSSYKVIGEWKDSRFTPAVPFERGQTYRTSTGITFTIPVDGNRQVPLLMGSFPTCDTVPSNLLKIYLQFSEPMSEARSAQFVQLYDDVTGDTIKNAFLDLQPELWNENGTVLTLWLDPGRIKQDLIPNKKLGVVMNENRSYRLVVAKGWRAKNGLALEQNYKKIFVTTGRDVIKPDVSSWSVKTKGDTVIIDLQESLDWSLIRSTISIKGIVPKSITEVCENKVLFFPVSRGDYSLNIESRLEDLAGNNLNRLFETDVTAPTSNNHPKAVYTISFHVN
ncbi:MAG: hypothetical protein WDO15_28105 [Bacteroidota bacterium]